MRKLRHSLGNTNPLRDFLTAAYQPTEWQTNWLDSRGRARWSAGTLVGIVNEGALVRVWTTQRDVTAQVLAEDGLRHALSLLRATLESTGDGILVFDAAGHIVDFNQRFLSMWSVPPALVHDGTLERAPLAAHSLKLVGNPAGFTERVHAIRGTKKSCILRMRPTVLAMIRHQAPPDARDSGHDLQLRGGGCAGRAEYAVAVFETACHALRAFRAAQAGCRAAWGRGRATHRRVPPEF